MIYSSHLVGWKGKEIMKCDKKKGTFKDAVLLQSFIIMTQEWLPFIINSQHFPEGQLAVVKINLLKTSLHSFVRSGGGSSPPVTFLAHSHVVA